MVPGWVYQGGYTRGVLPSHCVLEEGSPDSEAGPGSPGTGLEWVVRAGRTYRRLDGSQNPPLRGPVALQAPWFWDPRNAASWPI